MIKLLNDYWRNAPPWARHIAQNADGSIVYFERKPHTRIEEGIWYAAGRTEVAGFERPEWAKLKHERPLIREPLLTEVEDVN